MDTNVWKKSNMIDHIHFLLRKVKNKEPFSVIRSADAEYFVLKNMNCRSTDEWTYSPGGNLQKDLGSAIHKACKNNTFIGIPCYECNREMYDYYINEYNIPENRLTHANIFCNRNFRIFISFFSDNRIPFCYIGPGKEETNVLNVIKRYVTDEFLVHSWDENGETFKTDLYNWIAENIDCSDVFMFSVGPISKIAISDLAEKYPNKTFIDSGSTLDIFLKGRSNRLYLNSNQPYFNQVCDHNRGHSENTDITVILTGYKRPQHLKEQVEAVKNQTLKPKEIILWVNGTDFDFEDEYVTVIKSSKNFGVWARFSCALLASTKYVCVLDDDTIPGMRWFENCYETMKHFDGLLGTIGVVFDEKCHGYKVKYRVGWDNPSTNVSKVDIVGHSWFFKKEWLQHLWKLQPIYELDEQLVCGEDIGFSCALQNVGIDTFVPPHPPGHYEFFGSIPEKAWKYGTENVGVSMQNKADERFSKALNYYLKEYGFKLKDGNNF